MTADEFEEFAVALVETELRPDGIVEALQGIGSAGGGLLDLIDHFTEFAGEEGGVEGVFVFKVKVDGPCGVLGFLGDFVDGGSVEAVLGEDALGGGEDGGSALLFLAFAPGGGGRPG